MLKRLSLTCLIVAAVLSAKAQLIVDETVTPEQAVEDILIGDGVQISNITFSGDANQIGSFNSENSNIPLPEGVVIGTGDVNLAVGPNNSGSFSLGGGNFVSDPDLETANPGFTFNDVAVLEFDFMSEGDSVKFNYVWSSEEYPEFVNSSFNDAFGFFLSGPGIDGPFSDNAINIALVPETTLPISIDNVNAGTDDNGCTNCEYYVINTNNTDPNSTQMDGFTVALEASAEVQCGEEYHIKIVLGDAGDTAYDSAVFLEAGSFSTSAAISASVPDAPPSLPPLTMLEGCVDGIFTVFRPNAEEQDTLFLELGGTATELDDYTDIPDFVVFPDGELTLDIPVTTLPDDLVEGLEFITLTYDYTNACGEQDTIIAQLNIQDYIPPSINLPEQLNLCGGEAQTVDATPENGFEPFTYEWSTGGSNATESVSSNDGDSVFVTVSDFCGSVVEDSLAIIIPPPFIPADTTDLCTGASTPVLASGGAEPYTVDINWFINGEVQEFDDDDPPFVDDGGYIFTNQFEEGTFEFVVTDECGLTEVVLIEVGSCVTEIPNIFTPNGDGTNENFHIFGLEGFPGSRLVVYNRWGTIVYEDDNYSNNWNGGDVSDGVYYYVLTRSDDEQFSGSVTIKRD